MRISIPDRHSTFQYLAKLHRDSITEGFLSTLGLPFLSTLYKGIAKEQNSGILVAIENEKVLGFISYSKDVKTCYKRVLFLNFLQLCFAMIPNAFKLSIYKKVFETLMYPFHKKEKAGKKNELSGSYRPELLSMAVSEDARGKGIGKMLVKAVDSKMKEMGVEGYYVVTHGVDDRSNVFYQRCGFEKVREFVNHGKPMNEYYKKLREIQFLNH